MTAEQMKKLKELVLNSCKINYVADFDAYELKINDDGFLRLIGYINNLKKEVIK